MATEIEARLKISAVDRTAKAFESVERRLKEFERKQSAVQSAQGGAAAAVGRVAAGVSIAAVGAKTAMVVRAAIVDYAALERQMTRIGLAADATDQETKAATSDVAHLAQSFAMPMDQAVSGLDALVATGMRLPEAMAFLPSILRTAQASGAATEEMARSAAALATSMHVPVAQMQSAFDALVVGGQLGMFELKDMARYLPSLSASATKLGFAGQDGVARLVAMLQTVRQVSGTSEEAATAVRDAFEKILSPTVANAFRKRGVDIQKVLVDAGRQGKNQFDAVIETLDKMTKGMDETQRNLVISSIFTEADSRRAIVAMIQLREEYENYRKQIGASGGATEKNLQRVLGDSQASVDRLAASWGRLSLSMGRMADVLGMSTLMDKAAKAATKFSDESEDAHARMVAIEKALAEELKDKSPWEMFRYKAGLTPQDFDRLARQGGYVPGTAAREAEAARAQQEIATLKEKIAALEKAVQVPQVPGEMDKKRAELDAAKAQLEELQRQADAAAVPEIPGGVPLPVPDPRRQRLPPPLPVPNSLRSGLPPAGSMALVPLPEPNPRRGVGAAGAYDLDVLGAMPTPTPRIEGSGPVVMQDNADVLRQAMEGGGRDILQAGTDAAQALHGAADDLRSAGRDVAASIAAAARSASPGPGGRYPGPNADLGQSMPNAGTPGR